MSAKATVTTFLKSRSGSSIFPGTSFTAIPNNDQLYFGSNGEIDFHFDSTRQIMDLAPDGNQIQVGGLNMAKDRIHLQERFTQKPNLTADATSSTGTTAAPANKNFEIAGTNAASTDTALDSGGGVAVSTHGSSADYTCIGAHTTSGLSAFKTLLWEADNQPVMRTAVRAGANITAVTIWAGLKLSNTDVKATDADQVYFRYQDTVNSGKWEFVYSIGGTLTSIDCSVLLGAAATVAVSTDYALAIIVDSTRTARGYINGILVATSGILTAGTALLPFIGIKSGASAVKTFKVRHLEMVRVAA
jgi:hypothetical protein